MTRLRRLLARFFELSLNEQRLVLSAAILMPGVWVGLRMLGLQRFLTLLQRPRVQHEGHQVEFATLQTAGRIVNAAAHHTLGANVCLTRSVVLWWLLRLQGIETRLRLGVRLSHGQFLAHAWVEHGDRPINDRFDIAEDFAPFDIKQFSSEECDQSRKPQIM